MLSFSADTLRFDTVFTELGSATRSIRVHNNNDKSIRISRIYLEQMPSRYRINADGLQGPEVRDIEIRGRDSVWIFVEVTIDPDAPVSVSPFISEDLLVFETNGNIQRVVLEAWGQNANYIPNRFHANRISILSCALGMQRWDDPKPYVIYGTLLIDSCTVVLPAGTRLYVHGGIADNVLGVYNDGIIYTLPRGRLVTEGTVESPVVIRDDRLEQEYTGLWGGIRFGPGSGPHQLEHTIIRHAVTAVAADSATRLTLRNCIIDGTAGSGLFARHALQVTAVNCLFYNHASSAVALTYGGNYSFDYCTIASYGNDAPAVALTNFYCYDPLCADGVFVHPLQARFRNCIMAGSSADELQLADAAREQNIFQVQFDHCIVQVRDLLRAEAYPEFFSTMCTQCAGFQFGDALFVNNEKADFQLDSLSIALNKALPLAGIHTDLVGNPRDSQTPDIGCYESVR